MNETQSPAFAKASAVAKALADRSAGREKRKAKKNVGQSLIELLVALGVFVISISAGFQLFFGGQNLSIDSANIGLASDYGQEAVEAVRTIQDRNWAELTDGSHGLVFQNNEWMFGSSSVSESRDIFTRTIAVGTIDANTKIATTTITWQTDPLRTQTVELVERLTNWQEPSKGCVSDPISGNWAAPRVIGSADIGAGNSGTDVALKLPYAFVSGTASTASKPDLFVFNTTNETAPALVTSINIGSGGINALYVKDNYLYAASPNDNTELLIFNITDPANPAQVGSYNMTGSSDAFGVAAFGNTVAVGRSESATYELTFFNVTNPASPSIISQITTGGAVRDFYVAYKKLYLISDESDADVWIYDITDTANPTLITAYDIPGTTEDRTVYVQEKGGTNILVGNEGDELITIGATNTAQMYVRDRINLGSDINDITCVESDLLFLATDNSTKEFLIVNGANPDDLVEYASLNFSQVASGIEYALNRIYVSVRSNDAFKIVGPQ